MSNEIERKKRNERMQQKDTRIERQKVIAKLLGGSGKMDKSAHYYHKHNVGNCGSPVCLLCSNPRKFFKQKTIQELRFEETVDWVEE